jgi:hypothetical protein
MNEQIRLLQAEIRTDMQAIAEAYHALYTAAPDVRSGSADIVAGYYLNVLYGLFENLFTRIAANFGNRIHDESQWHAQLLHRMTLDVQDVRPRVISDELYQCLNEMRRFRHVFRNAYVLHFDPTRLEIVLRNAERAEALYQRELNDFLAFLDELAV